MQAEQKQRIEQNARILKFQREQREREQKEAEARQKEEAEAARIRLIEEQERIRALTAKEEFKRKAMIPDVAAVRREEEKAAKEKAAKQQELEAQKKAQQEAKDKADAEKARQAELAKARAEKFLKSVIDCIARFLMTTQENGLLSRLFACVLFEMLALQHGPCS
jgi:colicin import membrane protein